MKITQIIVSEAIPPYDLQVIIENDDGSTVTMPKQLWDELEAQREQSGTL